MKATLRDAPPESIVSVSQNDGLTQGCQCSKCLAIEKEEGSPSGPLLRFVNAVADAQGKGPEQGAVPPPLSEIKDESYHVYQVGKMRMSASSYVWLAPTKNGDNVAGVWVDRIFMVRQPPAADR